VAPARSRIAAPFAATLAALGLLAVAGHAAAAPRWVQLGPDGGTVNSIAVDPADPSILYISTGGGVFKSIDGDPVRRVVPGRAVQDL
jgi:hypothetical protein